MRYDDEQKRRIIERANRRGFTLAGEPAEAKGARLDFPIVWTASGEVEVSWACLDRIGLHLNEAANIRA